MDFVMMLQRGAGVRCSDQGIESPVSEVPDMVESGGMLFFSQNLTHNDIY